MHLNYLGLVPKAQNASFFSPSWMPLKVHLWWVATVTNGLILVEPGWQATSFVYWNGSSLSRERLVSVQLLSCVRLFVTPWTAACQVSLSITNSRSSLKLTSIKSVMSSSHLILCHPLLLLPSVPPSIRVFSNESALMRWPKYWSFSFSIIPSKENFKGLSSELVLHTRKAIGLFYVLVLFSGYGIFAFHFYLLD